MVLVLPRGRKQHVLIGTRPGVQSTSASLNGMGAGGETLGAGGVHHRGGINFTVEDTTRLMQNLHRANVIAEQVGIRLYKE